MGRNRLFSKIGSVANQLFNSSQNLTTESMSVGNITYPSADGTAGQILTTNGNGMVSFSTAQGGGGGIQVYNLISDMPTSGVNTGNLAYVVENNKLYMWNSLGWFNIAIVNQAPTISIDNYNKVYKLNVNGSPLVLTLVASDPEGGALSWSYEIFGSLTHGGGETATIAQSDNVITITPTTNNLYKGAFSIEFTATDISENESKFSISVVVSDIQELLLILDNPNAYSTSTNDQFGYSVSISPNDNYAIVGANTEDDAGGTSSGKAYIFDPSTGTLLWTLNNPTAFSTGTNDNFGAAVAISNNYAIVGAPNEDSTPYGGASGKAYVFNPATGALLWTLDNPNAYATGTNDNFGWSVAISDSHAIVGAPNEDDANTGEAGKAYIFDPATGALLRTLNDPNAYITTTPDYFGYSVAISPDSNYAIVSAHYEGDAAGGANASGKAYIFEPGTGALLRTLNNPTAYSTSPSDYFGFSVAISNNYAIVGAYGEDDTGGTLSGKAYIFNPSTGALLWTLNNPNAYSTGLNDYFGTAVAISDNYAIVGAYQEDDAGGGSSGKAYVFNPATGALLWTLDNPNAYGTGTNDNFGYSVAISDNYAIVGANTEDDAGGTSSGKAYIFVGF